MVTAQAKKSTNGSAAKSPLVAKKVSNGVAKTAAPKTSAPKAKAAKVSAEKPIATPKASVAVAAQKSSVVAKRPIKNLPVSSGVEKDKVKKAKLVRDSFTMPEAEYAVLGSVKKACLAGGIEVKKSQLLRIGLLLLSRTEISTLKKLIADLAPLKAGRPKKDK